MKTCSRGARNGLPWLDYGQMFSERLPYASKSRTFGFRKDMPGKGSNFPPAKEQFHRPVTTAVAIDVRGS